MSANIEKRGNVKKCNYSSCGKKDIPALLEMQIEFEKYFQDLGSEYSYDITEEIRNQRKQDIVELNFSDSPLLKTLVAEFDGNVAGRISFFKGYGGFPPSYRFSISGLFVNPKYRALGIGEKLFSNLVEIAREAKIGSITWSIWTGNKSAIKFYERLGGKYFETEEDEYFMFLDVR